MIKEMFALYLTFASPVGDVELFVKELPNCDNASVIAQQEYAKRDIDISKLSQSGYLRIVTGKQKLNTMQTFLLSFI